MLKMLLPRRCASLSVLFHSKFQCSSHFAHRFVSNGHPQTMASSQVDVALDGGALRRRLVHRSKLELNIAKNRNSSEMQNVIDSIVVNRSLEELDMTLSDESQVALFRAPLTQNKNIFRMALGVPKGQEPPKDVLEFLVDCLKQNGSKETLSTTLGEKLSKAVITEFSGPVDKVCYTY
eukprot:506506_1